eukprot:1161125-Pelagomonas_calceolata.AAC.8
MSQGQRIEQLGVERYGCRRIFVHVFEHGNGLKDPRSAVGLKGGLVGWEEIESSNAHTETAS